MSEPGWTFRLDLFGRAHGTRSCYVAGCPKPECKEANNRYVRMHRKRSGLQRIGRLPHQRMDGRPVRDRLAALARRGIGYRAVAEMAGLSRDTVLKAKTAVRLSRTTGEAILRVPLSTDPREGQLVDAAPTWKQIERILREGRSRAELAREITGDTEARELRLGRDRVTARTARRVASVYDRLFWRPEAQPRVAGSQSVYETAAVLLGRQHSTWREGGACRDPEISQSVFYPTRGEPTAAGKAVCARCEVREQCAAYALTKPERFGIWGGLSEQERRDIRGTTEEDDLQEAEDFDVLINGMQAS